jgi:putative phosphoribosyl transferase
MDTFQHQIIPVAIPAGSVTLHGDLHVPPEANGLVLFAHGGGSSRHSPRNQRVAESLHYVGLATLLFDLLPEAREPSDGFTARLRNNVELQSERLGVATSWARQQAHLADLPVGYFGASDGAAVVLMTAAGDRADIRAIVTRGGRPDLADPALRKIRSPTMLIVGGNDDAAVALNLETWAQLRCEKSIEIIPGAGHLFEEPGALDNLAALTARWFSEHLRKDANLAA